MTTTDAYTNATKLRTLAEMSRDPQLYRQAAAAYAALGMHATAEAMIRRAEWYEKGDERCSK